FTVTALSVAENTNSVAITVVRTGATNTAVSVKFQTTNATAVAGSDYIATNMFSVTILDDTLSEGGQFFNIRLFNPTNTSLGASNLVLTITTNDSAFIAFGAATSS